ncbi:hormone-sensitive lipase [Anaeramoeba flamelloides]|uniref:Hormone-sensitive lipase n=1 Tax=Anaeramoeba flamelloides TaxID=1746091 RepID=A0AAV7YXR4_9EUKA|nr:hormone-sensitive lipase [Anaeramoeba flamelloides]
MNYKTLFQSEYRLVGKDLTEGFELKHFKVKRIIKEFESLLELLEEKQQIYTFLKKSQKAQMSTLNNQSKPSILSLISEIISYVKESFEELFVNNYPLDVVISKHFYDLHHQKTLKWLNGTTKKYKNTPSVSNFKPVKKRHFGFFGLLYALKDTNYQLFTMLTKIKPKTKNRPSNPNKAIRKDLVKCFECYGLLKSGLMLSKLIIENKTLEEQKELDEYDSKLGNGIKLSLQTDKGKVNEKNKNNGKNNKNNDKKNNSNNTKNKNNHKKNNKKNIKNNNKNKCKNTNKTETDTGNQTIDPLWGSKKDYSFLKESDLNSTDEWEFFKMEFSGWRKVKTKEREKEKKGEKDNTKTFKENNQQQKEIGLDKENYKNVFVPIKNVNQEILQSFLPSSTMLVQDWCDEMKFIRKCLNASHCASQSSYDVNSFVSKWGKYGINFVRYFLMPNSASREAAFAKTDPSIAKIQQSFGVADKNRLLRWILFHPYPSIKMEKVRYLSKKDAKCKLSKSRSTYGKNSLEIRIISNTKKAFANKNIIVFIHGGAFVAGTSMTHAPYLRRWSREANCTVIAIEYTLSPGKRIPGQIEECYTAWKWIVHNYPKKTLILAGDSAGGCLSCGLTIKIIATKDTKMPDALVMAYPAIHIKTSIALSRLLFSNEPLFSLIMLLRLVGWSRPVGVGNTENQKYGDINCEEVLERISEKISEKSKRKKNSKKSQNTNNKMERDKLEGITSRTDSYNDFNYLRTQNFETSYYDSTFGMTKSKTHLNLFGSTSSFNDTKTKKKTKKDKSNIQNQKKFINKNIGNQNFNKQQSKESQQKYKKIRDQRIIGYRNHSEKDLNQISYQSSINSDEAFINFKPNNTANYQFESVFNTPNESIDWENFEHKNQQDNIHENDWEDESIWSPLWMDDEILKQFPETLLLSGLFDPLLDDCSLFADRMWQIGKTDFHYKLYALPHGFWNFSHKFKFKQDAMKGTIDFFKYLFNKYK